MDFYGFLLYFCELFCRCVSKATEIEIKTDKI